jgi:hypothetical protein
MVAELLDAGHDSTAVLDRYSMDEVEAHYHAIQRLRAQRRLEFIVDTTVAHTTSKSDRSRHVKYLIGTPERIWKMREELKKPQIVRLFDGLSKVRLKRDLPADDGE